MHFTNTLFKLIFWLSKVKMQRANVVHHPKALWFLSVSQAFYCIALGVTNSLLMLYLIYKVQIPPHRAYEIFATMTALIYVLPLAGGYLGEKFGYILTIIVGFFIVFFGFILLSIPGASLLYVGIAFFAAGHSFVVPNTSALIGLHYSKNSILRNSGYTLYFMIYNMGFLLSPLIAGYVSLDNYNLAFLISACSVMLAFFMFVYCIFKIEIHPDVFFAPQVKYPLYKRLMVLITVIILAVLSALFLLQHAAFNEALMSVVAVGVIIGLCISAKKHSKAARLKIMTFLALCISSMFFWSLYMLTPSLLTIFIAQNVNRDILGHVLPPSVYYSLDAFFIIVLGVFFSWFWRYSARKNRDFSPFGKFAASLISIGIAYLIFDSGVIFSDSVTHLTSSLWIVLGYMFLSTGELLISPIALSMVGILMPKGQEGLGMGIWRVFMGFSAMVSGLLANLVHAPREGNPALTNSLYLHSFLRMGIITICIGLLLFSIIPKLKKLLQKTP